MPKLPRQVGIRIAVIPKEDLKTGWYTGVGRLGNAAYWDETKQIFLALNYAWGQWEVGEMEYGERGFDPVAEVPDYRDAK